MRRNPCRVRADDLELLARCFGQLCIYERTERLTVGVLAVDTIAREEHDLAAPPIRFEIRAVEALFLSIVLLGRPSIPADGTLQRLPLIPVFVGPCGMPDRPVLHDYHYEPLPSVRIDASRYADGPGDQYHWFVVVRFCHDCASLVMF